MFPIILQTMVFIIFQKKSTSNAATYEKRSNNPKQTTAYLGATIIFTTL